MKPVIGFIGLGLMGRPMAANLLKAGFPLVLWNRTPGKSGELAAGGAKVAATAREAAATADILVTIVSDPAALESVLWGAGVLEAMRRGTVLVRSGAGGVGTERRVGGGSRWWVCD
jgi:3-hydroxyisobutyrate dehydrogenase